jgi:hypothetical protein
MATTLDNSGGLKLILLAVSIEGPICRFRILSSMMDWS